MWAVYRKEKPADVVVEESEFHSRLLSGEWFDRPQINQEGNSDEAKRILQRIRERDEPGQRRHLRERILPSGELSGESDVGLRLGDEASGRASSGESREARCGNEVNSEKKKRGRPPKRP